MAKKKIEMPKKWADKLGCFLVGFSGIEEQLERDLKTIEEMEASMGTTYDYDYKNTCTKAFTEQSKKGIIKSIRKVFKDCEIGK